MFGCCPRPRQRPSDRGAPHGPDGTGPQEEHRRDAREGWRPRPSVSRSHKASWVAFSRVSVVSVVSYAVTLSGVGMFRAG